MLPGMDAMRRRSLLALPVLAIAPCARAQAPEAGRVPPPPGAQPRNDSGFGTEVLPQMAAREADLQRRLADYPNLDTGGEFRGRCRWSSCWPPRGQERSQKQARRPLTHTNK